MWTRRFLAAIIIACSTGQASAQGYVDQEAVAPLLESQGSSPEAVKTVSWHRYDISRKGSSKTMLAKLQAHLDSLPGEQTGQRLAIVELSNRVRSKYMMQRGSLLIPDNFPADFRSYSPYPATYAGAAKLPKLFIVDKYTQTFGAYENGHLVRWGLVCTGHDDNLTPTGRFSFNWKDEYRESTAAPEGEVWKLRWVSTSTLRKGFMYTSISCQLPRPHRMAVYALQNPTHSGTSIGRMAGKHRAGR